MNLLEQADTLSKFLTSIQYTVHFSSSFFHLPCLLFFFTELFINNWNILPPNTGLFTISSNTKFLQTPSTFPVLLFQINNVNQLNGTPDGSKNIYSTRQLTKTTQLNAGSALKKNNFGHNIHQNTT